MWGGPIHDENDDPLLVSSSRRDHPHQHRPHHDEPSDDDMMDFTEILTLSQDTSYEFSQAADAAVASHPLGGGGGGDEEDDGDYIPESLRDFVEQAKTTLAQTRENFLESTSGDNNINNMMTTLLPHSYSLDENETAEDRLRRELEQQQLEHYQQQQQLLQSPDLSCFLSPPPHPAMNLTDSQVKRVAMEGWLETPATAHYQYPQQYAETPPQTLARKIDLSTPPPTSAAGSSLTPIELIDVTTRTDNELIDVTRTDFIDVTHVDESAIPSAKINREGALTVLVDDDVDTKKPTAKDPKGEPATPPKPDPPSISTTPETQSLVATEVETEVEGAATAVVVDNKTRQESFAPLLNALKNKTATTTASLMERAVQQQKPTSSPMKDAAAAEIMESPVAQQLVATSAVENDVEAAATTDLVEKTREKSFEPLLHALKNNTATTTASLKELAVKQQQQQQKPIPIEDTETKVDPTSSSSTTPTRLSRKKSQVAPSPEQGEKPCDAPPVVVESSFLPKKAHSFTSPLLASLAGRLSRGGAARPLLSSPPKPEREEYQQRSRSITKNIDNNSGGVSGSKKDKPQQQSQSALDQLQEAAESALEEQQRLQPQKTMTTLDILAEYPATEKAGTEPRQQPQSALDQLQEAAESALEEQQRLQPQKTMTTLAIPAEYPATEKAGTEPRQQPQSALDQLQEAAEAALEEQQLLQQQKTTMTTPDIPAEYPATENAGTAVELVVSPLSGPSLDQCRSPPAIQTTLSGDDFDEPASRTIIVEQMSPLTEPTMNSPAPSPIEPYNRAAQSFFPTSSSPRQQYNLDVTPLQGTAEALLEPVTEEESGGGGEDSKERIQAAVSKESTMGSYATAEDEAYKTAEEEEEKPTPFVMKDQTPIHTNKSAWGEALEERRATKAASCARDQKKATSNTKTTARDGKPTATQTPVRVTKAPSRENQAAAKRPVQVASASTTSRLTRPTEASQSRKVAAPLSIERRVSSGTSSGLKSTETNTISRAHHLTSKSKRTTCPAQPSRKSIGGSFLKATAASEARKSPPRSQPHRSVDDARAKAQERIRLKEDQDHRKTPLLEEPSRKARMSVEEGVARAKERIRVVQLKQKETAEKEIARKTNHKPCLTVPSSPKFATTGRLNRRVAAKARPSLAQSSDALRRLSRETATSASSRKPRLTVPKSPNFATTKRYGDRSVTSGSSSELTLAQSTDVLRRGLRDGLPARTQEHRNRMGPTTPLSPHLATTKIYGQKKPSAQGSSRGERPTLACSSQVLQSGLRAEDPSLLGKREPKLTIPRAPKMNKVRIRELPKSTDEKEKEMMDYYKSHPFKATPLLRAPPPERPLQKPSKQRHSTAPTPFHLSTNRHCIDSEVRTVPTPVMAEMEDLEEAKRQFRALPLPNYDLPQKSCQARKPVAAERRTTKPKPFNLSLNKRKDGESSFLSKPGTPDKDKPSFKAKPVPKSTYERPSSATSRSPTRSPGAHSSTSSGSYAKGPSLATAGRSEKRHAVSEASHKRAEALARERQLKAKARQRETLRQEIVKAESSRTPVSDDIKPFALTSMRRHKDYQKKLEEKRRGEEIELRQQAQFQALAYKSPPAPERIRSERKTTIPEPFNLEGLSRHQAHEEERRRKLAAEEEERKMQSTFKAQPIPKYLHSPVSNRKANSGVPGSPARLS